MKRLIVLAAVEFALLVIAVLLRSIFWSYGADTGTFAQLIAAAPAMRDTLEAGTHFRFHWSPTLVLLWPLVELTRNAVSIQLLQAAATVTTAPLLMALFRARLGDALSFRLGLLALAYPPLVALGFDEFHELGLFAPLLVGMLLAADRGRWGWYALLTALAVGLREDVCIELAILGAVFAASGMFARKRALTVAGCATAAGSLGALVLYYAVIVPRLGGWNPSHFYTYAFASGPLALVASIFTHPLDVARVVLMPGKFTYVLEALAPLAFLPFLSRWSLLAVPGFAIVLLANDSYVWRMGDHYAALWIPWLLVGAGYALVRLQQRDVRVARRWVATAVAISAIVLVAFDPMHPLHYLRPAYTDIADARKALACVPRDATVATHDEWYAANSVRMPNLTTSLTTNAAYLVYASDFPNAFFQNVLRPRLDRELRSGEYRMVCRYGNVTVYRRT